MSNRSHVSDLRAAALPFVTRALRGPRLQRFTILSAILALFTVALGLWAGLSANSAARGFRTSVDLEESIYERIHQEFVVFADDEREAARLREMVQRQLHGSEDPDGDLGHIDYDVENVIARAQELAYRATITPAPPKLVVLKERATELLHAQRLYGNFDRGFFQWDHPREVARLQRIVDSNFEPRVEIYRSPLSLTNAFRMVGALASALLATLLLVFCPLLAGVTMAQEAHENTLMPLVGTAMRARDLVIGLFAGAFVVIGILAAPLVAIVVASSLIVGAPLPAFALLVTSFAGALFLSMLTQLVALVIGRTRAPGLVGIALLMFLGFITMVGAAFGCHIGRETAGVLAVLPEAASFHLIRAAFLPKEPLWTLSVAHSADFAMVVGAVGMLGLGLLGARALTRRIAGASGPTLTRVEAILGAGISVVLVSLADPPMLHRYNPEASYLLNTVALAVPFSILLMLRTPISEQPLALRRVPVAALVAEYFGYAAIHGVVALAMVGGDIMDLGLDHPVGAFYFLFCLLMVALVAIRVAAHPPGILARVATVACVGLTGFTVTHAAYWMSSFSHVHPVPASLQLALTVALPLWLIRSLTRRRR
ncbi:MAG: hypothetical protein KC636_13915 [Myxococcales bacterium]|nr:hypothetical protein [Myxococcales bacterium]